MNNIYQIKKIWRYPLLLNLFYLIKSKIRPNSIYLTYWINSNTFISSYKIKPYNWGDYVNVKLAELISGKTIIPSKYCSRICVTHDEHPDNNFKFKDYYLSICKIIENPIDYNNKNQIVSELAN